jgi:hypothetical protein
MPSFIEQMNAYLAEHADEYNFRTIEYGKEIILQLNKGGVIYDYFKENEITIDRFLDELLPLCEYKLEKFGNEKITEDDFEEIVNFLSVENDINRLIDEEHIAQYILDNGEEIYIPDKYTSDLFQEKYSITIKPNVPFDFKVLYEDDEIDDEPEFGFIIDLDDICWN